MYPKRLGTEPRTFDGLLEDRIRRIVDDALEAALPAQAEAMRELASAAARWPERMRPGVAAEYLGYAGPDSLPDGWKSLRHDDPFGGGAYYLKSELDRALRHGS